MAESITQYGITWTFDADYTTGQYCNGDYWVEGPVNIIDIDPAVATVESEVWNGSMINPPVDRDTGLREMPPMNYSSELNVAIGVTPGTPLVLGVSESLLSAIGKSQATGDSQSGNETIAVLTCVTSAPAVNSFRPPYVGADKTAYFNESDLDYTKLQKLTTIPASAPTWEAVARFVERPYVDFYSSWQKEYHAPEANMKPYGFDMCAELETVSLMLQLNYTNEEKRDALVGYVQVGIDFYAVQDENFFWYADGGNFSGYKWVIIMSGLVLGNTNMQNIGFTALTADPVKYYQEDGQSHYVTQADIDITNSPAWDPDSRDTETYPYDTEHLGMPEWGIRHTESPEQNNMWWQTYYRQCCNARAWHGNMLSCLLMYSKTLWNYNAFFDFVDRYMAIANGDADPFGYSVPGEESGWRSGGEYGVFTEAMWDTYRDAIPASPTKYIAFTI